MVRLSIIMQKKCYIYELTAPEHENRSGVFHFPDVMQPGNPEQEETRCQYLQKRSGRKHTK